MSEAWKALNGSQRFGITAVLCILYIVANHTLARMAELLLLRRRRRRRRAGGKLTWMATIIGEASLEVEQPKIRYPRHWLLIATALPSVGVCPQNLRAEALANHQTIRSSDRQQHSLSDTRP